MILGLRLTISGYFWAIIAFAISVFLRYRKPYITPLLLQLFINQYETLHTSYTCPVHVEKVSGFMFQ